MLVDSSVLVALLHEDDPHHERAKALRNTHDTLGIQQTVLAETLQVVTVVARRRGKSARAQAAERHAADILLTHLRLRVVPVQDLDLARRIHHAHPNLSFVDACGIADARSHGGLLTFDEEQARIAKSL